MVVSDEQTPLLDDCTIRKHPDEEHGNSVVVRILFCAFVISLSVAFTWVPMIYVFHLMTCAEYYESHPSFPGQGDRCSVPEIESRTASAVALLGTTTTVFGVINLIWAGWLIKRFGVKAALIQQTVWPAIRLCFQIVAVTVGSRSGMMIIQTTQAICMLGGPAGYLLALNTYCTEVVTPSRRTAVFGQLQGAIMFGTAVGYLVGGQSGDIFGIRRPYEIAFFLMLFSTTYTLFCLPYISPTVQTTPENLRSKKDLISFFGPVHMFRPRRYRLPNGRVSTHWGIFLLGAGVFWGVLATGFIPVLIQMYATNAFGFRPTENGYLMSFNSVVRGLFLSFVFPRIISRGREWYSNHGQTPRPDAEQDVHIPTAPADFEPIHALEAEQEPPTIPVPTSPKQGSAFDLVFLTWSLAVDGILTGSAALSRTGWHIYLAAFLLPLASGSAPAAKGVMMDMCSAEQRADALSAITLVEMIATLSTMSIFGGVFATLAEHGVPHLVFVCNASVAVLAVIILAFARFPPQGAELIVASDEQNSDVNE